MVKRFKCEDDEFLVESDDEEEVVDIALMHIKKHHKDMDITQDDVMSKISDF